MAQHNQTGRQGGVASMSGEPLFHAPWPAVALAVSMVGGYGLQAALFPSQEALEPFWFLPSNLVQGRWIGLLTSLFIHGGWPHALFNAGFALAFGAPISRLFRLTPWGALTFFLFYILCGVLANLGYALTAAAPAPAVIGASGAIAGLMGAASRLMGRREFGRLAAFNSPTVVGMGAAWLSGNLLIGLFGFSILSGGAEIAWQAHLFGYATGLLLISPAMWLLRLTLDA